MQYFQRYINFKCGEKTEGKKKKKKKGGGGGGEVTNDKLSVMSNKMKTYSSPRWISCWWIWGSSIEMYKLSLFFPLKKEKEKWKERFFFYNVQNTEMLWTWRLLLLIWCVKITFFITPPPPPPLCMCACAWAWAFFFYFLQTTPAIIIRSMLHDFFLYNIQQFI